MASLPLAPPSEVRDPDLASLWLSTLKKRAAEGQMLVDVSTFDAASGESVFEWAHRTEISQDLVMRTTAEVLRLPFLEELAQYVPLRAFLDATPIAFARQRLILGVEDADSKPLLLLASLDSWRLVDTMQRLMGIRLAPAFVSADRLIEKINTAYGQRTGQAETVIGALDSNTAISQIELLSDKEDLLDGSGRAPVIQLVNALLFEAVQKGASDIHFQPCENRVVVRMRVDGILFDVHELPKSVQEEITSRIKVQGKMNIAEKRLPQDGRATVQVGGRMVDLRIASLPASYGERVVIRLLDKSARLYSLEEVGMDPVSLKRFESIIHLEHGLILVTGPTGSGKSTTLYAALQAINTKDRNVVTLEDPIEYEIAGVSQTQINVKKGLTFATGLRNVLRQDPDIIMVGEIRDHETAVMAIQSALTGHLVFSTLHTNDAASAVTRLLDLGIEPYLVSSSLLAVMAQRLVRRVCPKCRCKSEMSNVQMQALEVARIEGQEYSVSVGEGCDNCNRTGYRGRLGIFELLMVDDSVREKIQSRANATEIRDTGIEGGMRLLRLDGIEKILAGKTTIEEVERVTMRTAL